MTRNCRKKRALSNLVQVPSIWISWRWNGKAGTEKASRTRILQWLCHAFTALFSYKKDRKGKTIKKNVFFRLVKNIYCDVHLFCVCWQSLPLICKPFDVFGRHGTILERGQLFESSIKEACKRSQNYFRIRADVRHHFYFHGGFSLILKHSLTVSGHKIECFNICLQGP